MMACKKQIFAVANYRLLNCFKFSPKYFSTYIHNKRIIPNNNNIYKHNNNIQIARFSTTTTPEVEGPAFLKNKEEREYIEACESAVDETTREDTRFMGWTALHWAAFKGNTDMVNSLINQRKSFVSKDNIQQVFLQDYAGVSPLHLAVEKDSLEVVDALLAGGCDANVKDNKQNFRLTPLHLAMRKKIPNITIITSLIKFGANVNQEALDKTTPLFKACSIGRDDIVSLLVHHGASINIQNNPRTTGWGAYRVTTPLHSAVSAGFSKIVSTLLENGGDVNYNLMDDVGETPLHVAAARNRKKEAEILLKFGANINSLDCFEATPLDYADDAEFAEFLVSHGAKKGKGKRF